MAYAFFRIGALAAGFFALVAASTALAQQGAPVPLDPYLLKPPAPGFETPVTPEPENDKGAKLELPTQFDLGTSQLRFDAKRDDPIPRIGIDAVDPTVLNPGLPQAKDSPLKPNYFGFTLSTPTH
jgi:hypothetical protein